MINVVLNLFALYLIVNGKKEEGMNDLIGNQSNIVLILQLLALIAFQMNSSIVTLFIFYVSGSNWSYFIYQVTMIIFFISELTCEQIDKLISDVSRNEIDLGSLFNEMLTIRMNIGNINKSVNLALFVKFVDCGMNISSLSCLIVLILQQESFDKLQIVGIIYLLFYQLIKSFIIIYSSAKLHRKCLDLNEQIEIQMNERRVSPDLNEANIIIKANKRIYFNAVFFDIKMNTFLTMLGQIISYVVIVIQTEITI